MKIRAWWNNTLVTVVNVSNEPCQPLINEDKVFYEPYATIVTSDQHIRLVPLMNIDGVEVKDEARAALTETNDGWTEGPDGWEP